MRRRFPLLLGASLLAAGCAASGASAPTALPAAAASPGLAAALLAQAGAADALTYEQALQRFGAPAVQLREGRGGLLSYRLPGCALALAFAQDGQGALRLAAVEIGPPTPAAPQPSLPQCAAAVEQRQ
jgi:hypothetical protein